MALLARASYDPGSAVSKATDTLLAVTALDTTNLRNTFTAPTNGAVMIKVKGPVTGATTLPKIFLGCLDGSTIKVRMVPMGSGLTVAAADSTSQEVVAIVTGLTAGNSYTWDAAYSVDVVLASTNIKYGGPNDASGADAWGAFTFEVWEVNNLLAGGVYDPAAVATKVCSALLAMTAMDTTNLRRTFTAPASGNVYWRIRGLIGSSTVQGQVLLGILDGATVKARDIPIFGNPELVTQATSAQCLGSSGVITGLTPGNSYTYDAAYGVQVVTSAGGIRYGGPDDTTSGNAWGGIAFDILTA